jgi:DNA primase
MSWIDELKTRIRITDVVSQYCRIKPDARMICCPFHPEKTPSCSLDTDRNFFYCFGCGATGDPIKFVELMERVNFIEACTKLAEVYGIPVTKHSPRKEQLEQNVLQLITNWCSDQLKKNIRARTYLLNRGLNESTIATFRLGWMPSRYEFEKFCFANKITQTMLDKVGLTYPVVRNMTDRVIFPIGSPLCALAGRTLDQVTPKYLNTAETPDFKKKQTLYTIPRTADKIFLVEGYLDVCMCFQAGLSGAASMGTSLQNEHVLELWTRTEKVVVCLDGDLAGKKAATKLANNIVKYLRPGKNITFVDLPENEDPASLILKGVNLNEFEEVTLAKKLWTTNNLSPETKLQKYKDLVKIADDIKDVDLRKLYLQEWKTLCFGTIKKKIDYDDKLYQRILMSVLIWKPSILPEVQDYLMSMDLDPDFHQVREILLKKHDEAIDFAELECIKSLVRFYPINKLTSVAPFMFGSQAEIVTGWLEVFGFYQKGALVE